MTRNVIAFAGAAAIASSAFAGVDPNDPFAQGFDFAIAWDDVVWKASENPESVEVNPESSSRSGVITNVVGSFDNGNGLAFDFNINFDPDPFVNSLVTVSNNLGFAQQFDVIVTVPTIALAAPTDMTGSISGTVGDANGGLAGGGTINSDGSAPFYTALVDGVGVQDLLASPQSFSSPENLTSAFGPANFSNVPGPALISSIGIRNRFELQNGSSGQLNSTFVIIPTQGSVALLAMAGVMTIRRRRDR